MVQYFQPYYQTNNIDNLIGYINETKPYRVNIRQFIDYRTINEMYNTSSTDFDNAPFDNGQGEIRVLNVDLKKFCH